MGCTNSHSEDIHKTSLLESDKFVTSLHDVPGYFNRTIQTADFLPPKFPEEKTEKPEMSYTGPPSHLQNSVDFHPYWHMIEEHEYVSPDPIKESEDEIPQSLLPQADTAQELRDIEVKEAITDLRQRVKESISEKLRENEEDFLAALSAHGVSGSSKGDEKRDTLPEKVQKPSPPPLPEEDYMDEPDSGLAQEEKDTIDFLDSVISESMAWDEETGEEVVGPREEDNNWTFASPTPQDESEINTQDYDFSKPLPGVNLDISSTKSTPPNSPNSSNTFSKSIYLPEDKNSFISNSILARQSSASITHESSRHSDARNSRTLESPGRKVLPKNVPLLRHRDLPLQ